MEFEKLIEKLLLDFETEANFFYMNDQSKIRKKFLTLAFAAGFDKGRQQNPSNRPVIKYNEYGEKIARYESLTECAKKEDVSPATICAYIKKRKRFKKKNNCIYVYE